MQTTATMSSTVYETIKASHDLPSPTGVVLEILKVAAGDGSSAGQIASVVESDPAIASRLLKLVNSPSAGIPRQIASVQRAVALLGVRTVTNLALGFSLVSNNRQGRCSGLDYETFWSESLARAVAARHLAHRLKGFAPDEAFTCALLSQIGQLAFATAFPDAYTKALRVRGVNQLTELSRIERDVFGIDHNDLAAEMMDDWHMPAIFRVAVRAQDAPGAGSVESGSRAYLFACILYLSGWMALVLTRRGVGPDTASALAEDAQRLGVNPCLDQEALDAIEEEWRDAGRVFSVQTRRGLPVEEIYAQAQEHREGRRATPLDEDGKGYLCSSPPHEEQAAPDGDRLRVLIVDDDPDALTLLETWLIRAGYDVVMARDGEEAMRALLTEGPPILITDWVMPNMDGLELCRAIRTHPGIAFAYIIIVTAHHTAEDRLIEALDAGADDYLSKPLKPRELLARLRAGERIARLQQELDARTREAHRYNAEMEIANVKLGRANEELAHVATTDELTNLRNRREALNRLSQHWASAERYEKPLAIMLIDVDRFKSCNDAFGHAAGDLILKKTAGVFRRTVRRDETVCRFGGEEFLILCPDSTEAMASIGAERLRRATEANTVKYGELTLGVTISIGVAERTPEMASPDDLLRAADDALYAAKDAGRNTVCRASKTELQASACASGKPGFTGSART